MEEKELFLHIQNLISKQNFKEAKNFAEKIKDETEKENVLGIISYYEKNLDESVKHFENALRVNPIHSDTLFNYSKVLFEKENYFESWRYLTRIHEKNWQVFDLLADTQLKQYNPAMALYYYKKAAELSDIPEMNEKYKEIKDKFKKDVNLAIFCLPGLDNFIKDIAEILSNIYNVRLVISTDGRQIQEAYNWADIVWLEWANEMAMESTNKLPKSGKIIICRLHGYEVFTEFPRKINWDVVDHVFFVAEHKRDLFFESFGQIINPNNITILRGSINLNKFIYFPKKNPGKNLAIVGNINYRKGFEILLMAFKELIKRDNSYKLYIRGTFQDLRYKIAIETMIEEMNLKKHIIFVPRLENIGKWLQEMDYILSTSIEESFHSTIGEAMAVGLKPVIHAWKESRKIWPQENVFNDIEGFVNLILNSEYNSEKYRSFIENNYPIEKQILNIQNTIKSLMEINYTLPHTKEKNSHLSNEVKDYINSNTDINLENLLFVVDDIIGNFNKFYIKETIEKAFKTNYEHILIAIPIFDPLKEFMLELLTNFKDFSLVDIFSLENVNDNVFGLFSKKQILFTPNSITPIEKFFHYNNKLINNFSFDSSKIVAGKFEHINDNMYMLDFILENENNGIIISGIIIDIYSNKIILPDYVRKSQKPEEILNIARQILLTEKNTFLSQKIYGFIYDKEFKENVNKNKIAYMWERGIPGTEFMPFVSLLTTSSKYDLAASFIESSTNVLEAASGFGYGAAYLSTHAEKVTAVDLAKDSIEFGKKYFKLDNIDWIQADVTKLPFNNEYFDAYVSYETIEHLPLEIVEKYIKEAYRVIKPEGKFIMSTPNRINRKNIKNPFHIKEYDIIEIYNLLKKYFRKIQYFSIDSISTISGIANSSHNMIIVASKK
ncbi:MAG TPA: methyltransferase type 11 [Thermosipho africanus]|nr:methyltransferase type 11 [Thermosipho africanus]